MKKASVSLSLFLSLFFVQAALSQGGRESRLRTKGYVNPQEIVSLDSTMRMDQALLVLGELSKQYAGKVIIDLEKHKNPIGVYIVNQHWRDALEMIAGHRVRVSQRTVGVMPCGEVDHSGNCGSSLRSRRTVSTADAWAKLHCMRITLRACP